MENKKYIASIDIFKYFCALMIVDSHVRLINIENSFLFEIFRFALYFFHCSFGYFFMKNLKNNSKDVLIKNIKRLITPLVFWVIIYTLINYYNNVLSGTQGNMEFLKYQIKSMFINGVGFHLWFLAALIIYAIITTYLYNNNKIKVLYPISIVLYTIGLLGSYYYQIGNILPVINKIINMPYFTTLCRLMLHGLPMFTMGVFIANYEDSLENIKSIHLFILVVVFFAVSVVEILFVLKVAKIQTNICSLGLCILTFPLFILLKNNPMNGFSNIAKPLKYISTFMYYSHPLFRTVIASAFMRVLGIDLVGKKMTIIVILACTITGYILYKINNKYLNRICS